MMDTKRIRYSSSSSPFSTRSSPSLSSSSKTRWTTIFIVIMVGVLIFLMVMFAINNKKSGLFKSKSVSTSPFDNKLVVNRFKRAYNIWNTVATDPMFVMHTKNLMEINSASATNGISQQGSKEIYDAYQNLRNHVKENLKFPEESRITVMYNDGIVFFDSILTINDVFFMKDGLPRPVNLYTLGSPLKDHNMLPEVANCLVVTDSSDNRLSGMQLTDTFYRKLVNEGYGFVERISSTFNRPYTYLAHVLNLGVDPTTGFVNIITVRIGLPVVARTEA